MVADPGLARSGTIAGRAPDAAGGLEAGDGDNPAMWHLSHVETLEGDRLASWHHRGKGGRPGRDGRERLYGAQASAGLPGVTWVLKTFHASSDGRPNDVDVYGSEYGVEDARQNRPDLFAPFSIDEALESQANFTPLASCLDWPKPLPGGWRANRS